MAEKAIAISGLKDGPKLLAQLKGADRQIMLANHPNRGGSPYIASKIDESKDMLDKTICIVTPSLAKIDASRKIFTGLCTSLALSDNGILWFP